MPTLCYAVNLCGDGYFIRGDANGDELIDQSDVVALLSCVFQGDCEAICDWETQDVNDDGLLDTSDAVYLLDFAYQGGPPPPSPFAEQGLDETEDNIEPGHSPIKGVDFIRVGTSPTAKPIQNGQLSQLHCVKWNNAIASIDPIVKDHDLVLLQSDNTPDCTDSKECVYLKYIEWQPAQNPNGWFDGIGLKLNQHRLKVVVAYPWTNINLDWQVAGGSGGCALTRTINTFTINAGRASFVLKTAPILHVKFKNITQNKVGNWVNVENITPGVNIGIKQIRRTRVAWVLAAAGFDWRAIEGQIGGKNNNDFMVWEIDSISDGGPDAGNRFGLGAEGSAFKTGDNIRVEKIRLWYPVTHYRENQVRTDITEGEYMETAITAWVDYERKRPIQAVGGVVWTGSAFEWKKKVED
jgi:hypothetical protein